ncbi:MAG: hypothetical protein WC516_08470 [Patescibacteria group bacterium]|jgi:hypothetical protein
MKIDEQEYLTDERLETIKNWDVMTTGAKPLVEYVISIWHYGDWGYKLYKSKDHLFKKERVTKLQLHTGGWSGNEQVIEALRQNLMFWVCWQKSMRGGHYWFEFKKDWWERKG